MADKEREAAASCTPQQPYPYPPPPFPNAPPPPFSPPATMSSSRAGEVMTTMPVGQSPNHVTPTQSVPGEYQFWVAVPRNVGGVGNAAAVVAQDGVIPPPRDKSLFEAYLLAVPLGVLGAHHFYLGRPAFGIMYFFTLGLLGWGWLIDLLRMPCLVSGVNKQNREKHEQLQQLKQHLLLQQQQCGGVAAVPVVSVGQLDVVFLPFEPRSLCDAYMLWFPFGLLGFHHFYLRNYGFGVLYFFTFGLLGIGWLVDLVRMPSLVRSANSPRLQNEARSYHQGTAHVFAISPAGLLGGHHFYLDRPVCGILYFLTFGLLGIGWVFDWFRTSCLVKRANAIRQGQRSSNRRYLDDAYILCFPLGFLGLHHFYLRRHGWGVLYFFTFGIFGIGWLIDWCRLPFLVKECNSNLGLTQPLIGGGGGGGDACAAGNGSGKGNGNGSMGGGSGNTNVAIDVGSGSQGMDTTPQPYPTQPTVPTQGAGYGYQYNTMVYPPFPTPQPPLAQGPAPGYYATADSNYPSPGPAPPSYEASTEDAKTNDKY